MGTSQFMEHGRILIFWTTSILSFFAQSVNRHIFKCNSFKLIPPTGEKALTYHKNNLVFNTEQGLFHYKTIFFQSSSSFTALIWVKFKTTSRNIWISLRAQDFQNDENHDFSEQLFLTCKHLQDENRFACSKFVIQGWKVS